VFTSKFVGTGPSSYKKRIYQAVVSQRLRTTGIENLGNLLVTECKNKFERVGCWACFIIEECPSLFIPVQNVFLSHFSNMYTCLVTQDLYFEFSDVIRHKNIVGFFVIIEA
jgi:hypothetical protein